MIHRELTVIVAVGTYGDVLPFAALGGELIARGHAVWLLSNHDHRALATQCGLGFGVVAPPHPAQDGPNQARAFHDVAMPAFSASYAAIEDLAKSNSLSIVAHDLALGAISAAEKLRLPCVRVVLSPCGLTLTRVPPLSDADPAERSGERMAVDRFRRERGLSPLGALGIESTPARLIVALFSAHFAAPRAIDPDVLFAGFPFGASQEEGLDAELNDFLRCGAPPIVFTPGTGVMEVSSFFAAAREVCARRSSRGVFLSRGVAGAETPEILTRPFVPLDQLLPRARLIVHHGGIGTTAQALKAALPQVIVPSRFDQPDNARRVSLLGLGSVVQPTELGSDVLDAAIGATLADARLDANLKTMAARLASENGLATAGAAISRALSRPIREAVG